MADTVDNQSSAVAEMAQNWPIITALSGGTAAMRQANRTYLPQWPNESAESYNHRLATATLYPAFSRTVEVLAAKPFSKALTLSDNTPQRIREWCDDIDMQGRNLQSFASEVMKDCVAYGISGVLVDYPKAEGVQTLADEKTAGVRPYFVHYPPGTVLGWRTSRVNGADRMIQLRLKETIFEPSGVYADAEITQIRVLTIGAWEIYRQNDKKDAWVLFDSGTTSLTEIPFVFFYGNRKGYGIANPPLIELAYQNVEHWQSSSDQATITHVARVPILTIIGANDDAAITVGASAAVKLPVGASMMFVEHSGAAISAGRTSLLDLEERMRQTGAELLVLSPGKVTATQVQSENEANKCALQRIAENIEDALDQCLQFIADWVGEADGGNVELFKDFGAASLTDASAQLLLTANVAGKLSDQTLISEWKRRGILASEIDFETEQEQANSNVSKLQGEPLPLKP